MVAAAPHIAWLLGGDSRVSISHLLVGGETVHPDRVEIFDEL